jgi:peptide chain release factor 2
LTHRPDFWNDPKSAEELLRNISGLKSWTSEFDNINTGIDDLVVLYDFFRENEATEKDVDNQYNACLTMIEDLEVRNMLRKEEDQLGAILKINAGAGGTESNDWASILLRMYIRWAERNNYKVKEHDFQPGDEVGVKSVTLEIDGERAYGYLKSENGVHRLVRISPFNAQGKRQRVLLAPLDFQHRKALARTFQRIEWVVALHHLGQPHGLAMPWIGIGGVAGPRPQHFLENQHVAHF